ncbi:17643_t:CDS:2 [Racocetra fulgida]|uniref:17643_t:CDS:1 n=1 Tax=Racocetra fulgida TaxID=60492 RepID=A0A9N8WFS2_9GLOM|nr:17643_t:CDS:2 [Racocetra fulgida]
MNKSKKWILPSGTCVEDVLFNEGISLSIESLIHSWTIDLSDLETKKLFTDEDWCEIEKTVYKQPLIDENVAKTLSRFRNVRKIADLRTVLDTTSYKDKNEPFEQEKHFDAEWIEHYGAIEVKGLFDQINSPERCKDAFKLGKSIHDMFACLAQSVKFNEEKVRQLQVVGLQHSGMLVKFVSIVNSKLTIYKLFVGLKLQISQLSYPKAGIKV